MLYHFWIFLFQRYQPLSCYLTTLMKLKSLVNSAALIRSLLLQAFPRITADFI